jgi:hypothetical protein
MARHERSGNNGAHIEAFVGIIAWFASAVPRIAQALDTLGAIAGFRAWSKHQGNHPIFLTREKMWQQVLLPKLLSSDGEVNIYEFGVAYGEASRWWLDRIRSSGLTYYGFDLFTGLPRAWRNMPAHAFDAGGKTPDIEDSRVNWIKGDVSETIRQFEFSSVTGKKFFIFDLDIFEPSLAVWNFIKEHLNPGDLIYLDEAFDMDERLLATAFILSHTNIRILASSTFGLVCEVR